MIDQQEPMITYPNGAPVNGAEPAPLDFATWLDLTTPQVKTAMIPGTNKAIQYLSFVPFDKLVAMQADYRVGTPAVDRPGYAAAVLQYVMVKPACTTPEQGRAALKACGPVILTIIAETTSARDDLLAEIKEQAKN